MIHITTRGVVYFACLIGRSYLCLLARSQVYYTPMPLTHPHPDPSGFLFMDEVHDIYIHTGMTETRKKTDLRQEHETHF